MGPCVCAQKNRGDNEGTGEQSKLAAAAGDDLARPTNLRQCPKCGAASLIRQEGCDVCTACTYSKCG